MTRIPLQKRGIDASRIALGCMPMGGGWNRDPIEPAQIKQAHEAVEAALSIGINFFDHADIYTRGKAETVFGQVLRERPGLRERMLIQSKCGIRLEDGPDEPQRYDFSQEHILSSVDGSLQRLGIDYLDVLLLHRPDPLMDPDEVAEALAVLKRRGKVRAFGVSNMSAGQIRLLQASLDEPLIVNQLQLSLGHCGWIDQGIHLNRAVAKDDTFPEGTLEYCRLENIQLQAWGPLDQGLFTGRNIDGESESVKLTAALVAQLAEKKGTTREAIVLAWLLKHPAGIQAIIGTLNPQRIRACGDAEKIDLTREEWYQLYVSARVRRIP